MPQRRPVVRDRQLAAEVGGLVHVGGAGRAQLERARLVAAGKADAATLAGFRAGLIRNKVLNGLFTKRPREVAFLGQRLFRSTIVFPANVPTGAYAVEVFLLRDGRLVSRFEKSLAVHKAGIEAQVFNFAHERSAWYGAIAIVIALVAGWLAGVIFRKV